MPTLHKREYVIIEGGQVCLPFFISKFKVQGSKFKISSLSLIKLRKSRLKNQSLKFKVHFLGADDTDFTDFSLLLNNSPFSPFSFFDLRGLMRALLE
ncbi:MAG: hypothetical protein IKY31_03885 [Bacteroidaceae bacterium]|nr:hypothetical protein [Bacteroidaceae bacterium]